jgi:protocatechuate 3,4-dioxygenase beta subunit
MKKILLLILTLSLLTACAPAATQLPLPTDTPLPPPTETVSTTQAPTETASVLVSPAPESDFFSQMGITLPSPTCSGLTQSQTEGPYYTPDTPERNSLLEDLMIGTRLILVGYVLDENCQPLPNAWLDFWQADANGEYDNVNYRLRGHQFTDKQGRYYLETIVPGLYSSRPIEHIHVKVRPEGGEVVTSQLYFPQQSVPGLTVTMEDRGDYFVGYFNFVVRK